MSVIWIESFEKDKAVPYICHIAIKEKQNMGILG